LVSRAGLGLGTAGVDYKTDTNYILCEFVLPVYCYKSVSS